jgi:hypothetical protein
MIAIAGSVLGQGLSSPARSIHLGTLRRGLERRGLDDHYYPQIGRVIRATIYGKGYRRAIDIAKSQHVALPHVAIAGLSLALWLLELWK